MTRRRNDTYKLQRTWVFRHLLSWAHFVVARDTGVFDANAFAADVRAAFTDDRTKDAFLGKGVSFVGTFPSTKLQAVACTLLQQLRDADAVAHPPLEAPEACVLRALWGAPPAVTSRDLRSLLVPDDPSTPHRGICVVLQSLVDRGGRGAFYVTTTRDRVKLHRNGEPGRVRDVWGVQAGRRAHAHADAGGHVPVRG